MIKCKNQKKYYNSNKCDNEQIAFFINIRESEQHDSCCEVFITGNRLLQKELESVREQKVAFLKNISS